MCRFVDIRDGGVGEGRDDLVERFFGLVKLDGINPYVDIPADVWMRLGGAGKVPVLVRLAGAEGGDPEAVPLPEDADRLRMIGRFSEDGWFRSTALNRSAEPARLYLDQWIRATSGVSVGDTGAILLRIDPESRELELPSALQEGLMDDPLAGASWTKLAPSRRREILSYLNFLKTPAALDRNVKKVLASLVE